MDSAQLESDEGMSPEFKKLAAAEIEEFKAEFRKRFPGRDAEGLTDEDLLREGLNTVGKAGKLGEGVRCVVSVSMLTEGWDANSVTHILGVRAFGTQLLCEQVVGRSRVVLSTADLPTRTENAPIVGESVVLTLDELKKRREQEVAFAIARLVLEQYYPAGGGEGEPAAGSQVWLFPQVLGIVRRWLAECVRCKDNTFAQLLLLVENAHRAAEKIHRAIASGSPGGRRVRAVLHPYDTPGTTAGVWFDTTKPRWTTAADRCHVNFVPCDSDWEAKFAQSLEEMDEVKAYVKNQNLGFKVPYTFDGGPGNYYPDYLLRVDDGRGMDDLLNLMVEITGQELQDKEAKADTARTLWVPAVNAEGTFGRWAFLEITDPWDAQGALREFLAKRR